MKALLAILLLIASAQPGKAAEPLPDTDLRGLVVPDEVRAVARAVGRAVARRELLGACLAMRGECSGVDMRMRMHACTPRTHAGAYCAVRAPGLRRDGRAGVAAAATLPHPHLRAQGHWQAAARAGAGGVRSRCSDCVTSCARPRSGRDAQEA